MTSAAIFTLAVIVVAVLLIVRDVAPPDAMLFAALVVFMAAGVVTPEQGLAGFGNPAVATVGALFIVAAGMRSTGVLENASRAVLGTGDRLGRALLRPRPFSPPFSPTHRSWQWASPRSRRGQSATTYPPRGF
ncbi:SLC13 family permease [Gemmatimonadota bacterium]